MEEEFIKIKDIKSCVYFIRSVTDKKIYIGSTVSFFSRLKRHFSQLKKNKHHCKLLQGAYNKYGEGDFAIGIIEFCEEDERIKIEQKWLKTYIWIDGQFNRDRIYNTSRYTHKIDYNKEREFEIKSPEGKIYKGIGIGRFCRQFSLCPVSINKVINKKLIQYKGWVRSDFLGIIETDFKFLNPKKELIVIKKGGLSQYCRENNINAKCMHSLWRKDVKFHRGWTRYDIPDLHKEIISPDNKSYFIGPYYNKSFAIAHNIPSYMLNQILTRKVKFYKGWHLAENNIENQFKFKFYDPMGHLIKLKFGEKLKYCKNNNLNSVSFWELLTGKIKEYKGYRPFIESSTIT